MESKADPMNRTPVQEQFGANAAKYTDSPVHAKGASLVRLIETTQPQATWRVLDVATGAGHTALAFAPHVESVVASDVTPEMLIEAERLADQRGLTNVSFASADATALPFADDSFDLVTCRIAPHHFGDVGRFCSEAARVLKPGGKFGLVDNLAPDAVTNAGASPSELAEAAEAYNALEKLRDRSHARALGQSEWIDLVSEAGLSVVHTEHLSKRMSFNKWCETMSVPAETQQLLRSMLENAPALLKRFLNPQPQGDDISFGLTELLLVAQAQPRG